MRYIVHLLPEERQRVAFDALRDRVAAAIGQNKALDYPTAHVTLLWDIEDQPDAPVAIDPLALAALLDREAGSASIALAVRNGMETIEHHLLLPMEDTARLAALRQRLLTGIRAMVSALDANHAARVREQTWPHLTIAQDVEGQRWRAGLALIQSEGEWVRQPVIGAALALVARDVAVGQPYAIAHQVAL